MPPELVKLEVGDAFEGLSGPGQQLAQLVEVGAIENGHGASVLDSGFRDHGSILTLYHTSGLRRYVGIDTKSRDEFRLFVKARGVESAPEELVRPSHGNDEYQEYLLFHKWSIRHGEPLGRSDYHKVFELFFQTAALDFLRGSGEQFDIVILSDLLHLIANRAEADEVLERAIRALKASGLLYLQVFLETAPDLTAEKHPYSLAEYGRIKGMMKTILQEFEVSKGHVRLIGLG